MIPLNGRIAIVENEMDQAMPLFKEFSKNQMPYVFYKGDDYTFLPQENSRFNDIRLLFLDLNLLDKAKPSVKQVKSTLYGVLKRVISEKNYPYSIVLWSKQEGDYANALDELFDNELKDRAPISVTRFLKSDFFALDGEVIPNNLDLIDEVRKVLIKNQAYSYLLNWENKVHLSADKTLQEVFSSYHSYTNWSENANYLVTKLGVSYAGRMYGSQTSKEKLKSSYNAMNIVFNDTLENMVNTQELPEVKELKYSSETKNLNTVFNLNSKLLISDEKEPMHYSGTVIKIENESEHFKSMLHKVLTDIGRQDLDDIYKSGVQVWLNVTPLCDTIQGKVSFHRLVRGFLIKNEDLTKKVKGKEKLVFDAKSEAIFMSPIFTYNSDNYSIILDFRHFFTLSTFGKSKNRKPLFRVRQQLLAEIQSKLARHVNRQGILFLDRR